MAWQKYDEKNPFGKGAWVISEDNLAYASLRRQARIAKKAGKASAEQLELLAESERLIQQAIGGDEDE